MSSMPIRRSGSMFSPSAQIKALQNLNKSRVTGQIALPFSPVGNEQARNSALAPAAGFSTTNPTGAQTTGASSVQNSNLRRPTSGINTGYQFARYIPPAEMSQNNPPNFGYDRQNFVDNGNQYVPPASVMPPATPVTTPQSRTPTRPPLPFDSSAGALMGGRVPAVPFIPQGPPTSSLGPVVGSPVEQQARPPALGGGTMADLPQAPVESPVRDDLTDGMQSMANRLESTVDRFAAIGRGEGPNAQAGLRVDNENYKRAYDEQSRNLQRSTGITDEERANWTPEQGYNFGSNLFDGARSGGAIGAGMARRFGSGSALAAAEESSRPRRRMTDEEAMKKSEDAMKARVPERGILATPGTGFTRTDDYGNKAYTSRAQYAKDQLAAAKKANDVVAVQQWQSEVDDIDKEQSAAKARYETQKEKWRETHGGMTEREYKKIKRMESAVSRGMIPQERLDSAKADIQMKIDKGFGRSSLSSSALSNKPVVGIDGQFDAQTRTKAREGIKALVSPETASAPGEKQKTAGIVQQFGYGENDSFFDFNAKTTSVPKETWNEILKSPDSVKDVFRSIKEYYRLRKEADREFSHEDANERRNGKFAAGHLRDDAQRYEDMLGIDENDINAMTKWVEGLRDHDPITPFNYPGVPIG